MGGNSSKTPKNGKKSPTARPSRGAGKNQSLTLENKIAAPAHVTARRKYAPTPASGESVPAAETAHSAGSYARGKNKSKSKGSNTMKKLTKSQKAAYPAYIAEIDYNGEGLDKFTDGNPENGYFRKALPQDNLAAAIKYMDNEINLNSKYYYIVDILQKSGEDEKTGEPIYRTALMTRVDGRPGKIPKWHLRDEAHSENDKGNRKWYPDADGEKGYLEFLPYCDMYGTSGQQQSAGSAKIGFSPA